MLASTMDFVPDFSTKVSTVSLTQNKDTLLCGLNSQRFALFLCGSSVAQVWLSPQIMTASNQGLILPTTGSNLILNFRHHGGVVCQEWHAFTTVIGAAITIIEVVYMPRER